MEATLSAFAEIMLFYGSDYVIDKVRGWLLDTESHGIAYLHLEECHFIIWILFQKDFQFRYRHAAFCDFACRPVEDIVVWHQFTFTIPGTVNIVS